MKKAILIDVVNRIVTNVTIGDYKEMYPLIGNGCSLFTMPLELENGDGVFVDDEGLLHDKMVGGFMIEGYAARFCTWLKRIDAAWIYSSDGACTKPFVKCCFPRVW